MQGNGLILADGTEIAGGMAGYSEGKLWCYVNGYTMQQVAAIFFDAEKTATIVYQYGEMHDVHEGFTVCTAIMQNYDGLVSICLTRGDII